MYEFKMDFFDNGKPEEILFFVINFKMVLNASVTLAVNSRINYRPTLLCVEALCQFDNLRDQVGSITMSHFNRVVLGLVLTFFL